ncbi:MAG: glycosyltransferase family 2 protein [Clostridiales bacterium]|nr:glycosyltransferase family 2 protein [Clostridiales bacterium]
MIEKKLTVGIIIPAYNEENKIRKTIESIKHLDWIERILVIDDGSADNTARVAANAGADVISLPENRGKACAMKTGYLNSNSDILVFLDADIDDGAEHISKLVAPIWKGEARVVIARFPMTSGAGGFGMVKGLAHKGLHILTGKSLSSVLSGQRAFLRSELSTDLFDYRGFGIEFGMTVDMLSRGMRIKEVDVNMRHRITSKDWAGFRHRFRQFCDILSVILHKLIDRSFQKRQVRPTRPKEQDKT